MEKKYTKKEIEAELRNVAACLRVSLIKGDDEMYDTFMGMIHEVFKNLDKKKNEIK